MAKQAHIVIHGRVQGVSFRFAAIEKARDLGIKGWVRNSEDGTVEITAEGEEENLEKFINWCRRGPLFAKVTKLDFIYSESTNKFKTFNLAHDSRKDHPFSRRNGPLITKENQPRCCRSAEAELVYLKPFDR